MEMMMAKPIKQPPPITVYDAKIGFLNFSGNKGIYNNEGERSFSVFFEEDQANELRDLGWNVKTRVREVDGEEVTTYHIPVKVGFGFRPPTVCIVTSSGKTNLHEGTVGSIDSIDINYVDLTLRPYVYDVNGNQGVKAYLQSIYVTMEEDELFSKYNV